MGFFDSSDTLNRINILEKKTNSLNESNESIQIQIDKIKFSIVEVEKRSPEYEKEAKQSSKKTSEFKNKAADTLNEINLVLTEAVTKKNTILDLASELSTSINDVKNEYAEILESRDDITLKQKDIDEKITAIEKKITDVEAVFAEHPDIESEISNIETLFAQVEDAHSKSNLILKTLTTRKNEIDRLHDEILGYNQINEETEEETFITGLKRELEVAYEGLDEKLENLKTGLNTLELTSNSNYTAFIKSSEESNKNLLTEWENKYTTLNKKIESLLPNALTAGLSYAFSDKKKEEVIAYKTHKLQFGLGIIGMIVVSLIPFAISVYFLIHDVSIDIVINRIPRIALAILPLYIPVLWLSISSSKKMNLSKRLIEEYSHKEVLSKTFEGLSTQIENISEDNISNDLRITLLQNFLYMYSENPGKLISNYDSSDHPVMELLENTNRLETTIDKLNKIPGMQKIVKLLQKRVNIKINQTAERIDKGIDKALAITDDETNRPESEAV